MTDDFIPKDSKPLLLIVCPVPAYQDAAGNIHHTRRFLKGIQLTEKYWPGPVRGLMPVSYDQNSMELDFFTLSEGDMKYYCLAEQGSQEYKDAISNATAVSAMFDYERSHLAKLCSEVGTSCIYVAECDLKASLTVIWNENPNPLRRIVRLIKRLLHEPAVRDAARLASGLQSNGTPGLEQYGSLNENTLLFFDNRILENQLIKQNSLEKRLATLDKPRPLQLAFSGRLMKIKGAHHLIPLAIELKRRGFPFHLHICGGGYLQDKMARLINKHHLSDEVTLMGVLDFDTELLPFLQDNIDIFIACHIQSDPSCTYTETLACGLPILGYDNIAFAGMKKLADIGWTSPIRNIRAMADKIVELDKNRSEIAHCSREALKFASNNTFDKTTRKRVEHYLDVSRASGLGHKHTTST